MLFPDLFLVLFFWLHHAACRILVPHPGIKPKPSVVKLWSPNHQTSRKFSGSISCDWFYFLSCFLPFLIFYCKLNIMGPSVFRFLLSFWVRPIFEVFKTDFFFFFWSVFCPSWDLSFWPGMELRPSAVKAPCPYHWPPGISVRFFWLSWVKIFSCSINSWLQHVGSSALPRGQTPCIGVPVWSLSLDYQESLSEVFKALLKGLLWRSSG